MASNAARQAVAMIVDGFRVDPETGEILPVDGAGDVVAGDVAAGVSATPTARVRSLAESIVGVAADASDEDLPF
jgi:hypothetical protein